MTHPHELRIPPAAAADDSAREMMRAWGAGGGLHITLAPDLLDDPGNWGIVLADVTRHLADAYAKLKDFDRTVTIDRIRELFEAELDSPTDAPTGFFVKG